MKKYIYIIMLLGGLLTITSCSDWLEVKPKNDQLSDEYWQSKEEVEAVLASGYIYLRNLTPNLIKLGELRGGSIYSLSSSDQSLQTFQMRTNDSYAKWETFYKVINMANSILDYAPGVRNVDGTYTENAMQSHLTEAYFLRALSYFYLVRNWKEVPLVLKSYVDDSQPFDMPKASEADVIAQIKADIETALNTGAAKDVFNASTPWENKGRATKWALYALMTDVCLWSEDYDGCIKYADMLINANASFRPVFQPLGGEEWFKIFSEGNQAESIFELNFSTSLSQDKNSPSKIFNSIESPTMQYSMAMTERLKAETEELSAATGSSQPVGRAYFGAYVGNVEDYRIADMAFVWKYYGMDNSGDRTLKRNQEDANFIIYRMTDVMLMKAEALIRKGGAENFAQALELINKVRTRAELPASTISPNETDELAMLQLLLNERDIEFAAEGKRWYDLMRFGRAENGKFKSQFIQTIIENNQNANAAWFTSVLSDEYAWFLPIHESEIEANNLLQQNPYYAGTTQKR